MKNHKSKILILTPLGLSVRNFICCDIVKHLEDRGCEVYVAVFGDLGAITQDDLGESRPKLLKYIRPYGWYKLMEYLGVAIKYRYAEIVNNPTNEIFKRSGKMSRRILYFFATKPFPKSRFIHRMLYKIFNWGTRSSYNHNKLIRSIQPDVIVSTASFRTSEKFYLNNKYHKGKTVQFIHSWDNLYAKGGIVHLADYYIAWGAQMKKELTELYPVSKDRVFITGLPQHDLLISYLKDREAKQNEKDNKKRYILYTVGFSGFPEELDMAEIILEEVFPKIVGYEMHLILRFRTQESVEDFYKKYPQFVKRVIIDIMSKDKSLRTFSDGLYMHRSDVESYARVLASSAIVINMCSTTSLDAIAMDIPVINVAFDGHSKGKNFYKSVRRFYYFNHYKPLIDNGAVRLVFSTDEMISAMQKYLDEPETDKEGREWVRQYILGGNQFGAAKRIADCIADIANNKFL